jgi:hypothetical protein
MEALISQIIHLIENIINKMGSMNKLEIKVVNNIKLINLKIFMK